MDGALPDLRVLGLHVTQCRHRGAMGLIQAFQYGACRHLERWVRVRVRVRVEQEEGRT